MLDGQRIMSGQPIPIGSHQLSISHPKAEPFSTNLFIWYGPHHLGEIALKRSTGTLSVQSDPAAALLTIMGPEFAITLTNSAGMTRTVPTDQYALEAQYGHGRLTQSISVTPNSVASWRFAPRIGNLQLTCNQHGATYQLLNADGVVVESGDLPSTVRDLPEGSYKVVALRHGDQREETALVQRGSTKNLEVKFTYGSAMLESEPSGATVETSDGRSRGRTPIRLDELRPGRWEFVLHRDDYEPAQVSLDIASDQTVSFRTNLVSSAYVRAMNDARQYLQSADYDRALEAASVALRIAPSDEAAATIQKQATVQRRLQRAEGFGKRGEYTRAIGELESALEVAPDNDRARQLLADFKERERAQAERRQQEQTSRAKVMFDAFMAKNNDSGLFEGHELKTSKSLADVESGIMNALQGTMPAFVINQHGSLEPNTFYIDARQELPKGLRQCVVIAGQTFPDEVQVFWKVLEYEKGQSTSVLGGLVSVSTNVGLTPVRQTRSGQYQITEGIELVRGLLQRAVE